jgi:hypothetical protein
MLHEVLQGIGPAPVALGVLLLLVAVFKHRLPPSKSAKAVELESDPETLFLPQSISSNIPYVGHVLGYVRGGHSYFSSLWWEHHEALQCINEMFTPLTLENLVQQTLYLYL